MIFLKVSSHLTGTITPLKRLLKRVQGFLPFTGVGNSGGKKQRVDNLYKKPED